tara:strand:+ start:4101 stop:4916 length:816 start_codon:yes stop_codon:yes gene_type:complete
MKISIFTDEINSDPLRALKLVNAWDVGSVEVRGLKGGRFPRVEDTELIALKNAISDSEVIVSGVSPGFFKCPVNDPKLEVEINTLLPRACKWAHMLGTDRVSIFSFLRTEESSSDQIVENLALATRIVREEGCKLLLENEASCWGGTGRETASLLRQVGSQNLKLLWDPGNSARSGSNDSFPEEYEEVKDLIDHVHIKNFDRNSDKWSLVAEGVIDWPGQLNALSEDGYLGYLVVETHLRVRPSGKVNLEDMDALESNSYDNVCYVRERLR